MATHGHDLSSLGGDYFRSGLGVALTAGPLALAGIGGLPAWILGSLGLLFAVHGLRTVWRHLVTIECGEEALAVAGPVARRLAWTDLTGLRLRYFSTRRDRDRGWMQLVLTGGGVTIRLDSTLGGFENIARRAARAAEAADLALSAATVRNLEGLGIAVAHRA